MRAGYREDVCVNSFVPVGTKVRTIQISKFSQVPFWCTPIIWSSDESSDSEEYGAMESIVSEPDSNFLPVMYIGVMNCQPSIYLGLVVGLSQMKQGARSRVLL